MSTEFDLSTYLAKHRLPSTSTSNAEKTTALNIASEEKRAAFRDYTQQDITKQQQYKDNTWAGGLNLEQGGAAASTVNLGARALSGGARLAGNIGGGVADWMGAGDLAYIPESTLQAYARYQQGQASEEDVALLGTVRGYRGSTHDPKGRKIVGGRTDLEKLQGADKQFQQARDVRDAMDISSIVDNSNLENYQRELDNNAARYERGEIGSAGLAWEDFKSVLSNPLAQAELAADNAAQVGAVMLGPVGMLGAVSGSMGEARMAINEGREKHRQENQGVLPSPNTQLMQERAALGSAAMDFAGDVLVAGAGKGFKKLVGKPSTEAAEQALKKGLLASAGRIGKAAAIAGASEAPTELAQTYLQNIAALEENTFKDLHSAAIMGLGAGGATAGGIRTASEVAGGLEKRKQIREEKKEAVAKNPIEQLQRLANKPGRTDTAKEASVQKATDIVAGLTTKLKTVDDALQLYTPEGKQADINALATSEKNLSLLDESNPNHAEQIKQAQEDILFFKESIEQGKSRNMDSPQAKALLKQKSDLELQLAQAQGLLAKIAPTQEEDTTPEAVAQLVSEINTPTSPTPPVETEGEEGAVPTATAEAQAPNEAPVSVEESKATTTKINNIIALSMRSPTSITEEQAEALATTENNGLTQEQRDYFTDFAKARKAHKYLSESEDKVARDIYFGNADDSENLGLKTYREELSTAFKNNDKKAADKALASLSGWAETHSSKLAALNMAKKQAIKTGKNMLIGKPEGGKYAALGEATQQQDYKAKGYDTFVVNGRLSSNVIKRITEESTHISAMAQEAQKAYDMTFNAKASTNTTQEAKTSPEASNQATTTSTPSTPVSPKWDFSDVTKAEKSGLPTKLHTNKAGQTKKYIDIDNLSLDQAYTYKKHWDSVKNPSPAQQTVIGHLNDQITKLENKGKTVTKSATTTDPNQTYADDSDLLDYLTQGEKDSSSEPEFNNPSSRQASSKAAPTLSNRGATAKPSFTASDNIAYNTAKEAYQAIKNTKLNKDSKSENYFDDWTADEISKAKQFFNLAVRKLKAKGDSKQITKFSNYANRAQSAENEARKKEKEKSKPTDTKQNSEKEPREAQSEVTEPMTQQTPNDTPTEVGTQDTQPVSDKELTNTQNEEVGLETAPQVQAKAKSAPSNNSTTVKPKTAQPVEDIDNESAASEDTPKPSKSLNRPLGFYAEATPEGENRPYEERNLIADYTYLDPGNASKGTQRPLAAIPDLMNNQDIQKGGFYDFLNSEELTETELKVLNTFNNMQQDWSRIIDSFIKPSNETNQRFRTPLDFLIKTVQTPDGKTHYSLDNNVKTAMSLVTFSWIATHGSKNSQLAAKDINALLGRSEDDYVPPKVQALLENAGHFEEGVADQLGRDIVKALGLRVLPDMPKDIMPKLEAQLGAVAMRLMLDKSFNEGGVNVQHNQVAGAAINRAFSSFNDEGKLVGDLASVVGEKVTFEFIKPFNNGPIVKEIRDVAQVSNILDQFFQVQLNGQYPTLEPVKFNQKFGSGTRQEVPSAQAEVFQEMHQKPKKFRVKTLQATQELLQSLQDHGRTNLFYRILGGKTEAEIANSHISRRDGLISKNSKLQQDWNNINTFTKFLEGQGKDIGTNFYFQNDAWSNQRSGYLNNAMNYQGSQVVRALVQDSSWEREINLDDAEEVALFKVMAGAALGFDPGKQSHDDVVKSVDTDTESLDAALEVVEALLEDRDLTTYELDTIYEALQNREYPIKTLTVLLELAAYNRAVKAGDKTFTTTLSGEADGIANGVIATMLAFGGAMSAHDLKTLLIKGGIKPVGSDIHSDFNIARKTLEGGDVYQSMNAVGFQYIKQMHSERGFLELKGDHKGKLFDTHQEQMKRSLAIWASAGISMDTELSRDFVKKLAQVIVYGASSNTGMDAMFEIYMDAVMDRMEHYHMERQRIDSMPSGPERSMEDKVFREEWAQFIQNLNTAVNSKHPAYKTSMSPKDVLSKDLFTGKWPIANNIKWTFKKTMGFTGEMAAKQFYHSFSNQRNLFLEASNRAYEIYNAAFEGERLALIREKLLDGTLPHSDNMVPLRDLTYAEEASIHKKLAGIRPMLMTAGASINNDTNAGIDLSKTRRVKSKDGLHTTTTKFRSSHKTVTENKSTVESSQIKMPGYVFQTQDAGASPLSVSVHAMDSAIIHTHDVQNKGVFSMHDAIEAGGNIKEAAKAINKSFLDTTSNYSPLTAMRNLMEQQASNLGAMIHNKALSPEALANLDFAINDTTPRNPNAPERDTYLMTLNALRNSAYAAEQMRNEVLSQTESVGQYSFEGGAYFLTDAERAAYAEKAKQSPEPRDKVTERNLGTVSKQFNLTIADQMDNKMSEVLKGTPEANASVLFSPIVRVRKVINREMNSLPENERGIYQEILKAMDSYEYSVPAAILRAMSNYYMDNKIPYTKHDIIDMVGFLDSVYNEYTNESEFGDLKENDAESRGRISHYLENTKEPNVAGLLAAATTNLHKSNNQVTRTGYLTHLADLLSDLMTTADGSLSRYGKVPIRYITKQSDKSEADYIPPAKENSAAWYFADDTSESLHVLAPEFARSSISNMMALHETLHVVLAKVIADIKANPKADPKATALVKELETLLEEARKIVDSNSKLDRFQAHVSNLDEFISYGLTDAAFQSTVLAQVYNFESQNTNNPYTQNKLWQKFISALGNLFFSMVDNWRKQKAKEKGTVAKPLNRNQTIGAFNALVLNTSGLLQIAKNREAGGVTHTGDAIVLHQVAEAAIEQVTSMSPEDLLNSLDGTQDTGFDGHLQSTLESLTSAVYGPLGTLKAEVSTDPTLTSADAYLQSVAEGNAGFASNIITSGFRMSGKELYVAENIEAVVRSAVSDSDTVISSTTKQLETLYNEAYKQIKPEDLYDGNWANATQAERAEAMALHDFTFKLETKNGKSDHLSRFTAMGLGNQKVHRALQSKTMPTQNQGKSTTLAQRVGRVLKAITRVITMKHSRLDGSPTLDSALGQLARDLYKIEARNKRTLLANLKHTPFDTLADIGEKAHDKVLKGANKVLDSNLLKSSRYSIVRFSGHALSTVVNGRLGAWTSNMLNIRSRMLKNRQGTVAGLVSYVRGPSKLLSEQSRYTNAAETDRKKLSDNTESSILEGFANNAKDLTAQQKEALTDVFLRTDSKALLERFNLDQVSTFLQDEKARRGAIKELEKELTQFGYQQSNFFKNQAQDLGYFMATGRDTSGHLLLNTDAIVRQIGSNRGARIPVAQQEKARDILNVLVALRAMDYSDPKQLEIANEVLRTESQRKDGNNGVAFMIGVHKQLIQESQGRNFKNKDLLRMQGHVPELHNPNISVVVADEKEGQNLILKGYTAGPVLPKDPTDPSTTPKRMYIVMDGGQRKYASGSIMYGNQHTKGTTLREQGTSQRGIARVVRSHQGTINKLYSARSANYDPRKVQGSFMTPVLNPGGEIVDYRYMMNHQQRRNLLERDSRPETVLGALAASTFSKEVSPEINRNILKALHNSWKDDYKYRKDSYLRISSDAADDHLQQIWKMLPEETKQDAKEFWGKEEIWIHNEHLDATFGYRVPSVATMFEKDPALRNLAEKAFVTMTEGMFTLYGILVQGKSLEEAKKFAKIAGHFMRKGELMIQEVVKEAKDIIVIRTGLVLLGNQLSNMGLLLMNGVPIHHIMKGMIVGYQTAIQHQQDTKRLHDIQLTLAVNVGNIDRAALVREARMLEDRLAKNPATNLIKEGLLPSIAEDVTIEDDPYSYKAKLARKLHKWTDKLPTGIQTIGNNVYMSKLTSGYQFMSLMTQLSDYTARHTLYEHLTKRKRKPMSHEDAIFEVSEAFVNYDLPLPRILQYADSMGFTMFVKYLASIQRIILKTAVNHPFHTASSLLVSNLLDTETIFDSSIFSRWDSLPFSTGPLKYFEVLDEIATINATLSLIK